MPSQTTRNDFNVIQNRAELYSNLVGLDWINYADKEHESRKFMLASNDVQLQKCFFAQLVEQ